MTWSYVKKNSKDSPHKNVELFKWSSKVPGYTINTLKSIVFAHTDNEQSKKDIKEKIFHLQMMGKRQSFQLTVLRKLCCHMQKNEVELLSYTIYKN